MTREEAIKFGKRVLSLSLFDETHEFCELAVKALEQTALLEQVRWERDVAISQLHELGYEFGEKIEQQPCTDTISRTRLKEVFHRNVVCGEAYDELIDAQPPVTVQEKTGRWEEHSYYKNVYICSVCNTGGNMVYKDFKYCPNCGARMGVEE